MVPLTQLKASICHRATVYSTNPSPESYSFLTVVGSYSLTLLTVLVSLKHLSFPSPTKHWRCGWFTTRGPGRVEEENSDNSKGWTCVFSLLPLWFHYASHLPSRLSIRCHLNVHVASRIMHCLISLESHSPLCHPAVWGCIICSWWMILGNAPKGKGSSFPDIFV
jgi:hypothetical protein